MVFTHPWPAKQSLFNYADANFFWWWGRICLSRFLGALDANLGRVPLLEVDGVHIGQTRAIERCAQLPTNLTAHTYTHIYTRTLSHTFACVVMAVDQCYLGGILHIPKRNIRQNCGEKTPPALSTDTYAKLPRLI